MSGSSADRTQMSDKRELFKPDRNQMIAVVAMVCAVFAFGVGQVALGVALFVVAALFSLGGLFWNAHRQDRIEAEERQQAIRAAKAQATSGVATGVSAPANKD